ncbi:MAG: helix-turn-helix transcriptional regulator [Abitibacteriaceae bacterium]|nr:helix-turn-helix transcriptional regulator [Abditibacteriaceae bacterium]MBV9868315.1 helix-turn-helix transcriptional regulator [Abditibacteriaceae bacterium]
MKSLGETLRDARIEKNISLRALAGQMEITPSYLSDIENDRRVPAEDVLRTLASNLEIEFEDLMALAGRFGEKAERYMKSQPTAVKLFRRISEANLGEEQLREMINEVKKRNEQKGE